MKKQFITAAICLLAIGATHAQTKIKDGTVAATATTPNANAVLDIESNNKGLLLPRVALSSITTASPLSAFVEGMHVYNTASAGVPPNNVTPGEYYCDGSSWVKLSATTGGGQTWQDMNASRVFNTVYTNSTGKPITVVIQTYLLHSGAQSIFYVDNVFIAQAFGNSSWDIVVPFTFVVPAGSTYKITGSAGSGSPNPLRPASWIELR